MIDRRAGLDRLGGRLDLVVVGAGISGVCIAREAATRGMRVAVFDKGDIGAGTSSATTKYIHGGIRYLEQYDVGVVRESLRERRILALSAPHLVAQTRFLLPVWSWSDPGRVKLGAGVAAYDALSYDRNRDAPDGLRIGHPRWVGRRRTLRAVPWLDPDGLKGAWAITDTLNIHPERLLLALAADAVSAGAIVANHAAVTAIVTEPDGRNAVRVEGVKVRDGVTGREHVVRTGRVVNAAGPWLDSVLAGSGRDPGLSVRRSKGVHLLTRPLGGGSVTDAVLARTRDGRHVVVSPWQGHSFIGPTDTPVEDAPDDVRATVDDVETLLDLVNGAAAAEYRIGADDVVATTVGIRPLVVDDATDTYRASRRHELHDHAAQGLKGCWSLAGGKWTTGRGIGEDVVDRIARGGTSCTRTRPVSGAPGFGADPAGLFAEAASVRPGLGLAADVREHLARLYGFGFTRVLDHVAADPRLGERISDRPGRLDIGAQVVEAVVNEAAVTLSDIVDRRLVLGTLGPVNLAELERIAAIAAPLLGWSDPGRAEATAEAARRAELEALWRSAGSTTPAAHE